jgi:hypothetical protein
LAHNGTQNAKKRDNIRRVKVINVEKIHRKKLYLKEGSSSIVI